MTEPSPLVFLLAALPALLLPQGQVMTAPSNCEPKEAPFSFKNFQGMLPRQLWCFEFVRCGVFILIFVLVIILFPLGGGKVGRVAKNGKGVKWD